MENISGSLDVSTAGRDMRIANGRVCVRLLWVDGGYAQEFYTYDSHGRWVLLLSSIYKNLIPASAFRTGASPMLAGNRSQLFGICRESLRMVFSTASILRPDNEHIVVRLCGTVDGHELTCEMTLRPDEPFVHVLVRDRILPTPFDPALEYLMSSYAFLPGGTELGDVRNIDYAWAPIMRPAADHLIGDAAFCSPAAVVQHKKAFAALVPDLDILAEERPVAAALDLDLENGLLCTPLLSYGFCGYELADGGRHCRHDVAMSERLSTRGLAYGFYLLLDANCGSGRAPEIVSRFIWKIYGRPQLKARTERPGALAGTRPAVFSRVSALEDTVPDACAAYGLLAAGMARRDPDLIRQALDIREMILSAPNTDGLFPTAYDTAAREWTGCEHRIPEAWFSTAECSCQLLWLLKFNRLEPDERTVSAASRCADYLINNRLLSGAVPAWFTRDLTVVAALRSSAQSAAAGLLFAELSRQTGQSVYLRAAVQAADFIAGQMAHGAVFRDHTCYDTGGQRSFELTDPHSGTRLLGTHSMLWTAELFVELFELTGDRTYLRRALRVADQLSLLQCMREGPWNPEAVFGVCQAGNCGTWTDPEITAIFAVCAMRCGAASGEQEYFDRGTAALAAACSQSGVQARTAARIAALAADAQARFGCAFVHVANRWASGIFTQRIRHFEAARGTVRIDLLPGEDGSVCGRVVFGGLKRDTLRVQCNGNTRSFARCDLEEGILLPDAVGGDRQVRGQAQLTLFEF